jgi:multisubunit Na+/H+ antiporter MnhG subunit
MMSALRIVNGLTLSLYARLGVYQLTDFWYSSMRAGDKHPAVQQPK